MSNVVQISADTYKPRLSKSLKTKSLSRSKIGLYRECKRCFWLDVHCGHARVSGPAFSLNIAVDALMKKEYDEFRRLQLPHPFMTAHSLDAVPFQHADLEVWRNNFKGVRWLDKETRWTLYGAPDDLWLFRSDWTVGLVDYKATARAEAHTNETLRVEYRWQAEIYQFLLRGNFLKVRDRAYFCYPNGVKDVPRFDDRLMFKTTLVTHDGNDSWVLPMFREAVACAESIHAPDAGIECGHCIQRDSAARALECGAKGATGVVHAEAA